MKKVIIVRYSEIHLKGKNRSFFEKALVENIKKALKDYSFNIQKIAGRIIVENYDLENEENIKQKIKNVFGVYSLSDAVEMQTNKEDIESYISNIRINNGTFKVEVNRADKKFPIKSTPYAALLGEIILNNNPNLKVKLKDAEHVVYVDIRENGKTYIFYNIVKGLNGMPVGTSAGGLLLLSGGIDSPVAGFQMAKRGMTLEALHFHSFPYTSEKAKQKVLKLAKILSEYVGNIKIHVVKFTKVQEEIHKHCDGDYMITLMRRIMMRVAEKIAVKNGLKAIVTGESLAQVASQTIESITVTNAVIENLPVLRPLIGFDKDEIMEIANKIKTYETSILPYEDCCTVFLPEHPIIKPRMQNVLKQESFLNIDELVEDCVNNEEIIETKNL